MADFGEALAHANTSVLSGAVGRLSQVTSDPTHAGRLLQGEIGQFVTQQALTLAFQDVFLLLALLFSAALVLMPFGKAPVFSDQASAGH